jgi:hypothetical protein
MPATAILNLISERTHEDARPESEQRIVPNFASRRVDNLSVSRIELLFPFPCRRLCATWWLVETTDCDEQSRRTALLKDSPVVVANLNQQDSLAFFVGVKAFSLFCDGQATIRCCLFSAASFEAQSD